MPKARRKRSSRSRLGKVLLLFLLVLGVAPVGLVLLYRYVPPPVTPLMLIRLFDGEGIDKDWVPLRRISPNAVRAVISLEDANFCSHAGVDWGELFAALSDYFKGDRLRGASTISMQTAKNLFLWPGRDVARKVIEAPLTFLIEFGWDKSRIIEVYMNIAEWGPGIYGIEAASRRYFNKPAAKLSPKEAGLLAAVLPNPRKWSPTRPTAYLRGRVYTSLTRAATMGPAMRCARPERKHA